MVYITTKTLLPGKSGTKKEFIKYGENLIHVRYKYDLEKRRTIKTIEIIISEKSWNKNQNRKPFNKNVYIKIAFNEKQLHRTIKHIGGIWDDEKKLYKVRYGDVKNLGLENRIVELQTSQYKE